MRRLLISSLAAASILLGNIPQARYDLQAQVAESAVRSGNLEERILEIKSHDGDQLVFKSNLEQLRKAGISMEEILEIASVQKDGKSIFCNSFFMDYLLSGGTIQHLLEIDSGIKNGAVTTSDGDAVSSWETKAFERRCPQYKGISKILDKNGDSVYDIGDGRVFCNNSVAIPTAESYAKGVLSEKGYPFFNAEQLVKYLQAGGTFQYANDFLGLSSLRPRDLIELKRNNVDLGKFARFVKENSLDASTAAYYFALGIDSKDKFNFVDTEKPNALIVYGHDPDGAMRNEFERAIIRKLKSAYDVKVLITQDEMDIYQSIENIPNIMLLGINSHSSDSHLSLGNVFESDSERSSLNRGDVEFEYYLQKLDPSASIYVAGCSIGQNFSNYLAQWANGRIVFSSKGLISSKGVVIQSMIPFNMKFYSERGMDITNVQQSQKSIQLAN